MPVITGTEGYAQEADSLAIRYESFTFEALHRDVIPLFPAGTRKVLDIGSGTGRDAAAFAARGFQVLAVEPVAEMRGHAMRLHPAPAIEWLDDSLPELGQVRARGEKFDIVMMSAVLMHFDAAERAAILRNVVPLVAAGGILALLVRHGPVPQGRRMFDCPDHEVGALIESLGLVTLLMLAGTRDKFDHDGVTWSRLVFSAQNQTRQN